MPSAERRLLLRGLDQAFEHEAWHGPTLTGALRGVRPNDAVWRPAPGRNSIWDLTLHAAYWKYAVRRRLTGEKRGRFSRRPSNFPRHPDPPDAAGWRADIRLLREEHRALRAVVATLPDRVLRGRVGRWSATELIQGVAAHDIYHAGQIQLLKRLVRA